jgi:hypothetical protein
MQRAINYFFFYKILVGKPIWKRPLGEPSIDGKTVFEWILEKLSGKVWNGYIWLKTGTSDRIL